MLKEWRPLMCPLDVTMGKAVAESVIKSNIEINKLDKLHVLKVVLKLYDKDQIGTL